MDRESRINALLKMAQKAGILTELVRKSLSIDVPKGPIKFSLLGSVGTGTTLSASDTAVNEDGSVDVVFMIRGLLPSKAKGKGYKPWQYAPSDLGFNGAVVTAEAGGAGSKENTAAFGNPAWFNSAADRLLAKLQKKYPNKKIRMGNVTLASFSGGGGAIASLLGQRDKLKYPIKNVIGIDTFHLTNKNGAGYKAVLAFMEEARNDPSKTIHLVHSAVETRSERDKERGRGYASTTETADNFVSDLGLKRTSYEGGWTGHGPKPVTQIREGGLTITQLYDKAQPYMAKDPITGVTRPNILGRTSGGQHLASLIWLPNAIQDLSREKDS